MSEKTEQPTSKKVRDAREKGQVAKSQEIGTCASIIAVFAVFALNWNANLDILDQLVTVCIDSLQFDFRFALIEAGNACLDAFIEITAPLILAAALGGVLSHFMQVGVLISMKAAMPKLDKVSPKNWFKKVFSKKGLLELVKTVVKVVVMAYILQFLFIDFIDPLLKVASHGPEALLDVFGSLMGTLVIWVSVVFIAVAAFDYYIQKRLHTKELMMSKDEVKREYKESEGDPHIKSQRKQLHQEMVMNDTIQQTRKATVLVTNPTHLAVALFYKEGVTPLPIIASMGQGAVAQKMREIAEEEGIPIMQNIPLAHSLMDDGKVDEYIPPELIEPVAEVLKWVKELTGK